MTRHEQREGDFRTVERAGRPTTASRAGLALAFAGLALAGLASCFQSDSIECANGWVCPAGTKCASKQQVCLTNDCGDGVVNGTGEQCDDGNKVSGDGCSANCTSEIF